MRTLGIDLSADDEKTAACLIEWEDDRATAEVPTTGHSDHALLTLTGGADWIGIDAPFGWPVEFVEAITSWASHGRWSRVERQRLRFRETDRFVAERAKGPLSVSADRIAVTAMRCAGLLEQLGQTRDRRLSRRGDDGVVEVYPAAALILWSDEANDLRFDAAGYKGKEGRDKREALVSSLAGAAGWLNWGDISEACIASDDCLDAVLSSLVARAAALGLTALPIGHLQDQADIEGWIHVPPPASLNQLPG